MASSGMEGERSIQRGARTGRMSRTAIAVVVIVILAAVGVGAYIVLSPPPNVEIVRIDGSSTVFPIMSAWSAEFSNDQRQVVVAFSGTGGGFAKFCRGETDLSDASRPIKDAEAQLCAQNGIEGIVEFWVANDGLSLVVKKENTFVDNLTVDQLCRIWTSNTSAGACGGTGGQVNRWNELNSSWPDQPIGLYGPGTDSGTFDYFVEVMFSNVKSEHRDDYFKSEDDNVLVQGVSSSPHALGYFGFAYVEASLDKIRAVPVDDGDPDSNGDGTPDVGAVAPSATTIQDGSYAPFSRPLFVYGNAESLARPVVKDFLRFGYSARGMELVANTGYVGLNDSEIANELLKLG